MRFAAACGKEDFQEVQKLAQMSGQPAAARATQSRRGVAAQDTGQDMRTLLHVDTAQDMQAVMLHMPGSPAAASTKLSSGCCRLHGPMLARQRPGDDAAQT